MVFRVIAWEWMLGGSRRLCLDLEGFRLTTSDRRHSTSAWYNVYAYFEIGVYSNSTKHTSAVLSLLNQHSSPPDSNNQLSDLACAIVHMGQFVEKIVHRLKTDEY